MNILKKKKIIYIIVLTIMIPLSFSLGIDGIKNPSPWGGDINTSIKTMIGGLLKLALPFLVLAYIYVAFLFTKAQGEPKALEEAKKALIWVIVGTVIIVGAQAIYTVIEDTLKQANIKTVLIEKIIDKV